MNKIDQRKVLRVIEGLEAQLAQSKKQEQKLRRRLAAIKEPIAIIGMSCRFPGGNGVDEFWQSLCEGRDCIKEIDGSRWNIDNYFSEEVVESGKMSSKWAGLIDDVDQFDPSFFNMTPKEAKNTDPQHRLFLKVGHEAIEDSMYSVDDLKSNSVGVFAGIMTGDYGSVTKGKSGFNHITSDDLMGNEYSFIAGRLSYWLGVHGPSLVISTACSSGLVSVYEACRSLQNSECGVAIAGSVNLILSPYWHIASSKLYVHAKNGRCKTFDAAADGYVRGEGCGVFVLKRLSDAIRDDDQIHSVIYGGAINHGGQARNLTSPNPKAQAMLMSQALKDANAEVDQISYFETHGSGTVLGDAIEIEAINNIYGKRSSPNKLILGAVKTNIGHLEAAAGAASMVKTILSLKHGLAPQNLNFETLNPQLKFDQDKFLLPQSLTKISSEGQGELYGAISSFGLSGTNAQLILGNKETIQSRGLADNKTQELDDFVSKEKPYIIGVSSTNPRTVAENCRGYAGFLKQHKSNDIRDIAYSSTITRSHLNYRFSAVGNSQEDVCYQLSDAMSHSKISSIKNSHTVFIFSGSEMKDIGAIRILYEQEPIFRKSILECSDYLQVLSKVSLTEFLYKGSSKKVDLLAQVNDIYHFAVGYAYGRLLMSWGIQPDIIFGIGLGELIAACIAEAIVVEDAIAILNKSRKPNIDVIKAKVTEIPYISAALGRTTKKDDLTAEHFRRSLSVSAELADSTFSLFNHGTNYCVFEYLLEPGHKDQFENYFHGLNLESYIQPLLPNDNTSSDLWLAKVLADYWVMGGYVDWKEYYVALSPHRVRLPHRILDEHRYWNDFVNFDDADVNSAEVKSSKLPIEEWLYKPAWAEVPLTAYNSNLGVRHYLIFMNDSDQHTQILAQFSNSDEIVYLVKIANKYSYDEKTNTYSISPGVKSDYEKLFIDLAKRNIKLNSIFHFWLLDQPNIEYKVNYENVAIYQDLGFYSLLYVTQEITKLATAIPLEFNVIVNGVYSVFEPDELYPEKSTVLGMLKCIPKEYPNINCQCIDIDDESINAVVPELRNALKENPNSFYDSQLVAYRRGERFVRKYVQAKATSCASQCSNLRKNGVYIITGGLGGIGFVLAEYLAKKFQAQLVLVGRTNIPKKSQWDSYLLEHPDTIIAKKITRLRRLEKIAKKVTVLSIDISQPCEVLSMRNKLKEVYDHVHGIIHCAGLPPNQLIFNKDREYVEKIFASKVSGTILLADTFKDEDLDFFFICSSVAAIHGMVGAADYAAANAFQDAFAHYNRKLYCTKMVSVNWELWKETGIGVDMNISDEKLSLGISNADGQRIFSTMIQSEHTQCVVVPNERFDLSLNSDSKQINNERVSSAKLECKDYQHIENLVGECWKEVLGIYEVGLNDNFYDLGGNSLSVLQIKSKINRKLGSNIEVTDIFAYPTIAALATYLSGDKNLTAKKTEQAQHSSAIKSNEDDMIAIIGYSGRFPESDNLADFWSNILAGKECISQLSKDEIRLLGVSEETLKNKNYVPAGGLIHDMDKFDASFWGMSPRDAELMDPQTRLLLEEVWKSLEISGYLRTRSDHSVGVFVGAGFDKYFIKNILENQKIEQDFFETYMLGAKDILATRVAYFLNLHGIAFNINTACSTSLVSIAEACANLNSNKCDMALAGGVTLICPNDFGHIYKNGTLDSEDGHIRTFDKDASGIVFTSGVGVVVLKRLADALRDKDDIKAVIKGYAVNNDGNRKVSFTAPSVIGQRDCILESQKHAGITSDQIDYVECHGTATRLGDPIEIRALSDAFKANSDGKRHKPCVIGSVKANIGHTDTASGISGLLKVCHMLNNKCLPPQINFGQPNSDLNLNETPFEIIKEKRAWSVGPNQKRMAGVSSFGAGGTNAHIILEEGPVQEKVAKAHRPYYLLSLSAKSSRSLGQAKTQLAEYIATHAEVDLGDIAYTLHCAREQFHYREVFVCTDKASAKEALLSGGKQNRLSCDKTVPVVFLCSGVGEHYLNMGKGLYESESSYRCEIDRCAQILRGHLSVDIREIMFTDKEDAQSKEKLNQTVYLQVSVFTVGYALAKYWAHLGIEPSSLIGHSTGEYLAACLSGVLSLEDALYLLINRAQIIECIPQGGMLAVPLPEAVLSPYLKPYKKQLSLGAVNGPSLCVVSGEASALKLLSADLLSADYVSIPLPVSHAFHSVMLELAKDKLMSLFESVSYKAPEVPYISNVSGDFITEIVDASYWYEHTIKTVRFSAGVSKLLERYGDEAVYLEVGPGRNLASGVLQHQTKELDLKGKVLNSLRHLSQASSDDIHLVETLSQLWLKGIEIDWQGLYGEGYYRADIPTYAFEKTRYWLEPDMDSAYLSQMKADGIERYLLDDWFYKPNWIDQQLAATNSKLTHQTGLVFINDTRAAQALCQAIKTRYAQIVFVRAGNEYGYDEQTHTYTISPANKADYDQLFADLAFRQIQLGQVINLWLLGDTLEKHKVTIDTVNHYKDLGFYHLLFSVQSLSLHGFTDEIVIDVVGTGIYAVKEGESVYPEKALIQGMIKTIPQEYPGINCRSFDIDLESATQVVQELSIRPVIELGGILDAQLIGYRDGVRLIRNYIKTKVVDPTSIEKLKTGGVYLITGGLGGIGYVLGEYLAEHYQAKLVLLGRSELPVKSEWETYISSHEDTLSTKLKRLQALEALGGEVHVVSADLSKIKELREAAQIIRDTVGDVEGIIHSAGLPPDQAIYSKDRAYVEHLFGPKVAGSVNLLDVFPVSGLDFCLMCSSVAAIGGSFGESDYGSANAFQDALSAYYANVSPGKVYSVNWSLWREIGFAVDVEVPENLQADRDIHLRYGISNREGQSVFERMLCQCNRQLVIVPYEKVKQSTKDSETVRYERPELAVDYEAPRGEIESKVEACWQAILGINAVGIRDNFFDLGGNSLSILQLVMKLNKSLDSQLTAVDIYTYPTIADLTDYVGGDIKAVPKPMLSRSEGSLEEPIAIIGYSGVFPGATDVESYWDEIISGQEGVSHLSQSECHALGVSQARVSDPNYVGTGGLIPDMDKLDANFWGLSPRDAECLDPQARLLLTHTYKALEKSGYIQSRSDRQVGVFAGGGGNQYLIDNLSKNTALSRDRDLFEVRLLGIKDVLANRVSYALNLKGPAVNFHTACSTSLVAIAEACDRLKQGKCHLAVAGGANVIVPQNFGYEYQTGMVYSPDGHLRAFDANDSGMIMTSGAGVAVLKRLSEAQADGDKIYAVIKGYGINNDGNQKVSFTAPSVIGQRDCIIEAQRQAGIHSDEISYVECHGTATEMGDPIEVKALSEAFKANSDGSRENPCVIGSVKANIGHADTAAGIAGLIKVCEMFEARELPPQINYESPNPELALETTPFEIIKEKRSWQVKNNQKRIAGVSAFGIGGTNAHIILEEGPVQEKVAKVDRPYYLLSVSAKTNRSLECAKAQLTEYIATHADVDLGDIAYTLHCAREQFNHREMFVCHDLESAKQALSSGGLKQQLKSEERSPESEDLALRDTLLKTLGKSAIDKTAYVDALKNLGQLWLRGIEIDWQAFYGEGYYRAAIPTYAFDQTRYWIEPDSSLVKNSVAIDQKLPISDWFYQQTWVDSKLQALQPVDSKNYLIFISEQSESFVSQLSEQGHSVYRLKRGKVYSYDASTNTYTIDPKDVSHYKQLIVELDNHQVQIDHIIHSWLLDTPKTSHQVSSASLNRYQAIGFYSLLYLVQNLVTTESIQIDVVGNGIHRVSNIDRLMPEKVTIQGLITSIPQEYTHIRCRCIDTDEKSYKNVAAEIMTPIADTQVAYRDGMRLIKSYEAIETDSNKPSILKTGGTYLITGGLGGIGLSFARYLAQNYQAKLVLIGRSQLPERTEWDKWTSSHQENDRVSYKIKQIKKIEALGGQVLPLSADVSNKKAMQGVFEQTQSTFGELNGVFHLAGAMKDDEYAYLSEMQAEHLSCQLQPKANGLLILNQLIQSLSLSLDFVFVSSSLSATLGGIKLGAYAGANVFMDAYCLIQSREDCPWYSPNWESWPDATDIEIQEPLCRVLSRADIVDMVMSGSELEDRIRQWIKMESLSSEADLSTRTLYARPELEVDYEAPGDVLEQQLVKYWQMVLGIENIGINDDFFELGGNSLSATYLSSLLRNELNKKVSIKIIFEKKTVKSLGDEIKKSSIVESERKVIKV